MACIAVVGVGAIGGAVAAPLIGSGAHDVVPFAALVVEGPKERLDVPARCEVEPARVAPVDWVLLATDSPVAGGGRGYTRGQLFTRAGTLVPAELRDVTGARIDVAALAARAAQCRQCTHRPHRQRGDAEREVKQPGLHVGHGGER